MTGQEELRIIQTVLGGQADAFEALVLANQSKVYNLALKMTGNEQDALDIAQETFIKAYSNLDSFRGDSRFSVWLYRMTYNLCVDFIRKQWRVKNISLTYTETDESEEAEIADMRPLPEDELLRRETRESIKRGIEKLGLKQREILVMREITGMSYEELSSALGISEGTVKSRLSRARKSLAGILVRDGTFSAQIRQKGGDKDGQKNGNKNRKGAADNE